MSRYRLINLSGLTTSGALLSLLVLGSYLCFAQARLSQASSNNHFAYLAQSFLSGQISLVTPPPHGNDWASYEVLTIEKQKDSLRGIFLGSRPRPRRSGVFETLDGKRHTISTQEITSSRRVYFVSFPPLPALLMLPFVALFGLAASDVWLTLICAALNVPLSLSLFRLLTTSTEAQNSRLKRSDTDRMWITVSLALGTAHFWSAVRGEVWFTALIVGVTAQLLFLRWAWAMRRPLLAGLALAAAFSTRASLITLAVFAYFQLIFPFQKSTVRERLRRAIIFSLPPLFIGSLLLWYNEARFEKWYEFGHRYLAGGQIKRVQEYGLFHPIFIFKNLVAAFLLLPLISLRAPFLTYSWHGMAIQFSSPQLLWALRPNQKTSALTRPRVAISLTLCITLSLLLLYQNTGWVQYSWRFALDMVPMLCCLTLLSDRPLGFWFRTAVCWGIMVNATGAWVFGRGSTLWSSVNLPLLKPH